MELKFESLGELDQFMQFCAHVGRHIVGGINVPDIPVATGAGLDAIIAQRAAVAQQEHEHIHGTAAEEAAFHEATAGAFVAAAATTDKPKRTRRTKAEMEAARAGEQVGAAVVADGEAAATVTIESFANQVQEPEPRGNPFAQSPSTQAILEAPNQSAATLAGMAAMASGAPTDSDAAPHLSRADRVAQIMAEGALTDSLAHLKHCQKFIQQYGMAIYEKSFVDGLTPNIAVYTAEQCALHVAVMEELI